MQKRDLTSRVWIAFYYHLTDLLSKFTHFSLQLS